VASGFYELKSLEVTVTQGRRVLQEILLIRTALKQQGHRIQKQPKQAVWVISFANSKFYRLTYQPAPFSTWSLHPPDRNASSLLGIIQKALGSQPISVNGRKG